MTLLDVRGIDVAYGAVSVLHDVSLRIDPGERVALIGANGAGKTTTLRAISGLLAPSRGEIIFQGQAIHGLPPFGVVGRGVVHAPEGRALFGGLTVQENLRLGYLARRDPSVPFADRLEEVFGRFPRLKERRAQTSGTLSGGEQQMLVIARSLMAEPKLLMVDELSLGLAPMVVSLLFEILEAVHQQGTAILIVEQFVDTALEHTDRAYLLAKGSVVLEGPSAMVRDDPQVAGAYLGGA